MEQHRPKHNGFTLLELSIVLVIIGLVVGGILFGTTLVRSAQINKVISQLGAFDTAVVTFKNKYGGLPGDLANATEFFSDVTNGDADGKILWSMSDTQSAWQELGLSGLIPGRYSGLGTSLNAANAPLDEIFGGLYAIYFVDDYNTPGFQNASSGRKIGNYIELMRRNTSLLDMRGIVPPIDALAIDTKMDNGIATTGRVLGAVGGSVNCINQGSSYNYNGNYGTGSAANCTVSVLLSVQ